MCLLWMKRQYQKCMLLYSIYYNLDVNKKETSYFINEHLLYIQVTVQSKNYYAYIPFNKEKYIHDMHDIYIKTHTKDWINVTPSNGIPFTYSSNDFECKSIIVDHKLDGSSTKYKSSEIPVL